MNVSQSQLSDLEAYSDESIVDSGISYNALQKETGVTRASIMRFVRGDQSIRLDMADRLAEYFNWALSMSQTGTRFLDRLVNTMRSFGFGRKQTLR